MLLLMMMVKMLMMMIRWDIPFRKCHSRSSLYSSHPYEVLPVVVVVLGGMRVGSTLGEMVLVLRD